MKTGKLFIISLLFINRLSAQCGTAQGDQNTYGTNDTWIGYVYDNDNFTNYMGYVTEGAPGNMNFNQTFGGDDVLYPTNGCSVQTQNFSVRYKLTKNFANNFYTLTVGGDDGYRLSIDGGATWLIGDWAGHAYTERSTTVQLNGVVNLVIEYFEYGGGNRIYFNNTPACIGTDNETVYGTNDVWRGYVYDNWDFTAYKGVMLEGTPGNSYFDQNFGGDDVTFNTNACPVFTQNFSVRYRLRKTFTYSNVTFLVGGDDGYRLSLNGGSSWVIQNWTEHNYATGSYTTTLNGTYDMVLEYYEMNGSNRVSFDLNSTVLPVQLLSFSGNLQNDQSQLRWTTPLFDNNTDHIVIERSSDGSQFFFVGQVKANAGVAGNGGLQFTYTDPMALNGTRYYRLRMVDKNGTSNFSEIITLKNNAGGKAKLFPTLVPANTSLWLQTAQRIEQATFTITDLMGRQLMQSQLPAMGNNQTTAITLPTGLTKGNYLVQVKNTSGIILTQKIVVQ